MRHRGLARVLFRFQPQESLCTTEQYQEGLTQSGLPKAFASLVMYLFTTVLDGRNSYPADGVQQALGREPRDFVDYAQAAAATGVWQAQS